MKDWALGLLASVFILSQAAAAQAATGVFVSPITANVSMSSNFVIDVRISTDNSTYAAQFDVYYDATKLNATNATEGDFLKKDGSGTYPVISINRTAGRISCGITRFGVLTGVTGSGSLLMINFSALAAGTSSVGVAGVTIVDPNLTAIAVSSVTNGTVGVNRPPSASNLQIAPASPKKADNLTGSYTYSDTDGNPENGTEIRWYKDGALQAAYNNMLVIPSSVIAKGQAWYFTVRPNDGKGFGTLQASPNVTITNTPPAAPKVKLGPGSPKTMDDLNCSITNQSTDIDGDSITYFYRWYRNGIVQTGFTSNTLLNQATNKSDIWKCSVTPNDGSANGTSDESQVTIVNSAPGIIWFAPSATLLKIREGQLLFFNHSSTDPDGDQITASWKINGTERSSSANWAFQPATADCGQNTVSLDVSDGQLQSSVFPWNVRVWLRGDVNGDRRVDIIDLAAVGLAYGSPVNSSSWNNDADIYPTHGSGGTPEGNGRIDIFDLATVGLNYGRSC